MNSLKENIPRPPEPIVNDTEINIKELQNHYDSMKARGVEVAIFNLVFNADKTLFALIAGALTGLSTNVITGFLDLTNYNDELIILHGIQLFFAFAFNFIFILFSAKILSIKESGNNLHYIEGLSFTDVKKQQLIIIYNSCKKQIGKLKWLYCFSILFAILTLLSFFFGYQIIDWFKERSSWLIYLLKIFQNWLSQLTIQ